VAGAAYCTDRSTESAAGGELKEAEREDDIDVVYPDVNGVGQERSIVDLHQATADRSRVIKGKARTVKARAASPSSVPGVSNRGKDIFSSQNEQIHPITERNRISINRVMG
jgi:hypothetical protein